MTEIVRCLSKNTGVSVQIAVEQLKALLTLCQGHS